MNDTAGPNVDRAWADAFVLELRLRDVPGSAIGAALAEVESHCADSGEGARDAFGAPEAYARSLELPRSPLTRKALARPVLVGAGGTVGMLVTLEGFRGAMRGGLTLVTVGQLAGGVVLLAALGLLWWFFDAVFSVIVRGRAVPVAVGGAAVFGGMVGSFVVLQVLLDDVIWILPARLLLGLGVGMLLVVTIISLSTPADADPLRAPGEDPVSTGRSRRWMRVGSFSYLIATALLVLAIWVLPVGR